MESGNKQGLLAMIKSKSVDFIENVEIILAVRFVEAIYWLFFDANKYVIKAWKRAYKMGKEDNLLELIHQKGNSEKDDA